MDKDLAREIIRAAFRSGSEIEALIPLLKAKCTNEEYKHYKRQVATAIHRIHEALTDEVTKQFPDLEAEIESSATKTGRLTPGQR